MKFSLSPRMTWTLGTSQRNYACHYPLHLSIAPSTLPTPHFYRNLTSLILSLSPSPSSLLTSLCMTRPLCLFVSFCSLPHHMHDMTAVFLVTTSHSRPHIELEFYHIARRCIACIISQCTFLSCLPVR